jgi:hypothetical protein
MRAVEKLEALRAAARCAGGEAQIEKQHDKGKKTARERIEICCWMKAASSKQTSLLPTGLPALAWRNNTRSPMAL